MLDSEDNDLPARMLILSTMVVRLCGTGLIEFPPALCSLGVLDVTWVCAPRYEDLGRKFLFFFFFGLEVCISTGVGVAFRKNNS